MGYRLTIEPLGETLEVEDGQTVLDAGLAQGHLLAGNALLSRTVRHLQKFEVLEGEVDHGAASSFALDGFSSENEGKTLACCATLESDVVVHLRGDRRGPRCPVDSGLRPMQAL